MKRKTRQILRHRLPDGTGLHQDPDHTIKELVATKIAELGENIVIRRFTRYLFGEPLESAGSSA